jgi:cytochrome P450
MRTRAVSRSSQNSSSTPLCSIVALVPLLHRDLGRWSPWVRFMAMRTEFDDIVGKLMARAQADPAFEQREDVLSLMLQAHYEDGTAMSHSDIGDELFTLLVAGHETTATELAWAVWSGCDVIPSCWRGWS